MELVAGSNMAACTNADCAVFDSLQGPNPGSVALSLYGVASPLALSGSGGMMSVQLAFGTAELAGGAGRAAAPTAALCIWALSRSVSGGFPCAETEVALTNANPIDTTVQKLSLILPMIFRPPASWAEPYATRNQNAMWANSDMS